MQLKALEMGLRGEVSLEVDELPKQDKDCLALLTVPVKEAGQSREGGSPGNEASPLPTYLPDASFQSKVVTEIFRTHDHSTQFT